jgi:hypothetical protein
VSIGVVRLVEFSSVCKPCVSSARLSGSTESLTAPAPIVSVPVATGGDASWLVRHWRKPDAVSLAPTGIDGAPLLSAAGRTPLCSALLCSLLAASVCLPCLASKGSQSVELPQCRSQSDGQEGANRDGRPRTSNICRTHPWCQRSSTDQKSVPPQASKSAISPPGGKGRNFSTNTQTARPIRVAGHTGGQAGEGECAVLVYVRNACLCPSSGCVALRWARS